MSAITFDAIKYMDDLIGAGVSEPQAKVQSKALTRAIEVIVVGRDLVTKNDLKNGLFKTEALLKVEIKDTEIRLIKWIIAVNAATVGLLFAIFKLLG